MTKKQNIFLVTMVALILGILIVRQFNLHKRITQVTQPEVAEALAYEVAELIEDNTKSRQQLDKLQEQYDKLATSSSDLKTAKEAVDEKLSTYEIILGLSKIEGPGVIITFNDKIASTQLVDLLNAFKNIGVDAVTINDQRISPASSITNGLFNPPITLKAIGEPDLLADSLTRPGGIMEQIGLGQVEKSNEIIIDAVKTN